MESTTAAPERQWRAVAVTITATARVIDIAFAADTTACDLADQASSILSAVLEAWPDVPAAPDPACSGIKEYRCLFGDPDFGVQIDPQLTTSAALAKRWPEIIERLQRRCVKDG